MLLQENCKKHLMRVNLTKKGLDIRSSNLVSKDQLILKLSSPPSENRDSLRTSNSQLLKD